MVPVERKENQPEEDERMSFGDEYEPITGNTGNFMHPMESKPFHNKFMLNNLTSI